MHQLFHLFLSYFHIFEYFCYSNLLFFFTFFRDVFSFAWLINWRACLKKYSKSIPIGIIDIAAFIFSISNSSNYFFVVSSSFSPFILFILSISSFSITFWFLSIIVPTFSICFGFETFIYVKKLFYNNLPIL